MDSFWRDPSRIDRNKGALFYSGDWVPVNGANQGGLKTTNDWLGYAGYGQAALTATQMAMLQYRQTLPIMSKIGTFSRFSIAYRGVGVTGKLLGGTATYVAAPLNTYLDYKSMQKGEIGAERFSYRTAATGIAIGVGSYFGAIPGAIVTGAGWAGEKAYDGTAWFWDQFTKAVGQVNYGLNHGWVPGR